MEVKKLNEVFYDENRHLVEVLDKTGETWAGEKTRGYGIVLVEFAELKFGIPLRSHMKHRHGFIIEASKGNGLDYSKAVLLSKVEYISDSDFIIPTPEFRRINDNSGIIAKAFNRYVRDYIRGAKNQDERVLRNYRYTTLQNYHQELGITGSNEG